MHGFLNISPYVTPGLKSKFRYFKRGLLCSGMLCVTDLVVGYRNFGTAYQSHLQGSRSPVLGLSRNVGNHTKTYAT